MTWLLSGIKRVMSGYKTMNGCCPAGWGKWTVGVQVWQKEDCMSCWALRFHLVGA